jgi:membrane protein YdbS with pleckstrin-like domain
MRFVLFFIFLFVTEGCLLGAPVKNPFPNFGAVIILWVIYYLITLPGRRRRQYWRRQLEEQCMRTWLRNQNRYY